MHICGEQKMGYLLLRIFDRIFRRCYFVFSVVDNTDCNKRGQTSRFATGMGLRYRQVVTLKRTRFIAVGGWIVSVVGASTFFLNLLIFSLYQYIFIAFCLVTTICAYTKIFMSLPHNQIHGQNHVVQRQSSQVNTLNKARYRKAVYSALWVQVTLFICYLPFFIAIALIRQRGMSLSTFLALQFTLTLLYLNSSLNPLLYCWKNREVRQAVKETLQQLHFCIWTKTWTMNIY